MSLTSTTEKVTDAANTATAVINEFILKQPWRKRTDNVRLYVEFRVVFGFYTENIFTLLSIISRSKKKFVKKTDCTNAIDRVFVTNIIMFIIW